MKILVIGGTSFMGPHVVNHLANKGHEVAVYHRGQTERGDLPASVWHFHAPALLKDERVDRRGLLAMRNTLLDFAPDIVLDMILLSEDDASVLMDVFSGSARRVVAASSIDVYRSYGRLLRRELGEPEPGLLAEDSPLRELNYPYRQAAPRQDDDPEKRYDDYDKILVEKVILGNPSLPGTVLRLPMVYGPHDAQHRLFSYLKRMRDQRPAILIQEHFASWKTARGYVENVADAIALAVLSDQAAGKVYNVAEPQIETELDWIRQIAVVYGWEGQIIILPQDRMPAHLKIDFDARHHLAASSERIRQDLGYTEIVSRPEALRRTIDWELGNPPQQSAPDEFDYAAEDQVIAGM